MNINLVKPKIYVPSALTHIDVFLLDLRTNNDYFSVQH